VLGDDKPKYLNSPETPVYHKGRELYGLYEARKATQKPQRFVIVEGYMDVVALAQHGISFAVATLGTATNTSHLEKLFRLVPEIIFCFDGDNAGRAAAWRALQASLPVMADGRQIRFLFLPEGEDPDTLVRKEGADGFLARMNKAGSLSSYFFDHMQQDIDATSMDGKARLFSQSIPLIKLLPRGLFQQLMLDQLAQITGSQRDTIDKLLQQTPAASPIEPDAKSKSESPPDWNAPVHAPDSAPARQGQHRRLAQATEPAARGKRVNKPAGLIAIELLLHQPALAATVQGELSTLRHLQDPDVDLLLELLEFAQTDPDITTYALLGHCYGTPPGKRLTQLLKNERITPAAGQAEEFSFVIRQLRQEADKHQQRRQLLDQLKPRLRSVKNEDPGE
jgi:DNA primase